MRLLNLDEEARLVALTRRFRDLSDAALESAEYLSRISPGVGAVVLDGDAIRGPDLRECVRRERLRRSCYTDGDAS